MGVLGLWHCTLVVRGDPWTDAEKTGADVMDAVWVSLGYPDSVRWQHF